MIPIPTGWRLVPAVESFTLIPPDGTSAGHIKYRERTRPLLRLGQVVRRCLDHMPAFTVESNGEPERLVTVEGEHAALVSFSGREGDEPARRFIGVTFADDFYALTSALCHPEAEHSYRRLVRDLLLHDSLALGVRRRRYEYTPPPGWEPLTTSLVTEWFPPGFPAEGAVMTAYPANPRQASAPELFEQELVRLRAGGCAVERRSPARPIESVHGLHGQLFSAILKGASDTPLVKHTAVFLDARHAYILDLAEHGAPRHVDVFEATVRSIAPIPAGTDEHPGRTPAWHWVS